MLDVSALQSFHPVVMTPSHDGKFFQNYVLSLLQLASESGRMGMSMDVYLHGGESLVTRARNDCVANFLANPLWTHLLWVDSDIGFTPEAVFRLLLSGHDVVAGVYPLKYEAWPAEGLPAGTTREAFEALYTRYTVNTTPETGQAQVNVQVDADGFLKLTEAPTGFMLIKREVFERLMKAYPELRYTPDGLHMRDQGLHYRFFDVSVDPQSRRYLSEDYGFCRLWSGLGEHIYVDANSNLTHQGSKVYRGNFAASLTHALPHAVGAPPGLPMHLLGGEFLNPNPSPS